MNNQDSISKVIEHLEKTNKIIEKSMGRDSLFHDSSPKDKIFQMWIDSNNFALKILNDDSTE